MFKQMDPPLELFVVREGEEICFYTAYVSIVKECNSNTSFTMDKTKKNPTPTNIWLLLLVEKGTTGIYS